MPLYSFIFYLTSLDSSIFLIELVLLYTLHFMNYNQARKSLFLITPISVSESHALIKDVNLVGAKGTT